jgi:predicted DNA-binding transcriptional regulator YafY
MRVRLESIPDVTLPDFWESRAVATDESPTARVLMALELLQSSPGITAERIGDRLGVSERAARRCVATLREAGIPVESVRGPYGGYRLGRGVRMPPMVFTAAEALGLVMAVLDGHHDPSEVTSPVGAAVGKIIRSLPAPVARVVEAVRQVSPAPDRAAARPDGLVAASLVEACVERRRLRLAYRLADGRHRVMAVDPWAVVVRHARWYLLCWSHVAGERRILRVDRVESVEVLAETFPAPDVDDPVAAVETQMAQGWTHVAEVVIDAPVEVARRSVPGHLGRLEALGDGRTQLRGSTDEPHWYVGRLALSGLPFRVLGSPELRRAATELGQRLSAASG